MPPADGGGAGLDDGILRVELPVDRLKGVGHPGDRLHNVQALDHLHVHLGGVADEAQDGLVLPLGHVDPQVLFLQPVDKVLGAFRRQAGL